MPFWTAPVTPHDWLFLVAAFVLGTCIGSFLNVVIYRLPLGLSVHEPRRSFCPHCKEPIRPRHNLPLLGWLLLGGKCADCRAPISARYPGVELLTGLLFTACWQLAWTSGTPWLALPWAVLASILIASTFIDLDHLIIPDELTWGGTAVGVVLAMLFPRLVGESAWWGGLFWSVVGAGVGYGLVWLIVEFGKLAFGRRRLTFPEPQKFRWKQIAEDEAELQVGDEPPEKWSELFSRETDCLELECDRVEVNGEERGAETVRAFYNRLEMPGANYPLMIVKTFSGVVREAVVPREAMGLGDVKFMAAIGAFLGWKAVFFTVGAAAVVGSVLGLLLVPLTRGAQGLRLPFGPFLAIGALLWVFCGQGLLDWYYRILSGT